MKHRIETNVEVSNTVEVKKALGLVCFNLGSRDYEKMIEVDDSFEDRLCVLVKANGAVLRDVVAALDHGGYLD